MASGVSSSSSSLPAPTPPSSLAHGFLQHASGHCRLWLQYASILPRGPQRTSREPGWARRNFPDGSKGTTVQTRCRSMAKMRRIRLWRFRPPASALAGVHLAQHRGGGTAPAGLAAAFLPVSSHRPPLCFACGGGTALSRLWRIGWPHVG